MLIKGSTLHINGTGPDHDKDRGHLFIVLTNTCKQKKQLLVPVCTAHIKCDRTCLLGAKDHPFIRHESFVAYAHAQIYETDNLLKKIKDGTISVMDKLDAKIFAHVCVKLVESRYTPPKIIAYYRLSDSSHRV